MRKTQKYSIWDYLAWISLAYITIWILLKMFGVINTPIMLQYSPYLGAIYIAGRAMNKLDTTARDVEIIKRDLKLLEKDFAVMKTEMKFIKNDVSAIKIKCPNC